MWACTEFSDPLDDLIFTLPSGMLDLFNNIKMPDWSNWHIYKYEPSIPYGTGVAPPLLYYDTTTSAVVS